LTRLTHSFWIYTRTTATTKETVKMASKAAGIVDYKKDSDICSNVFATGTRVSSVLAISVTDMSDDAACRLLRGYEEFFEECQKSFSQYFDESVFAHLGGEIKEYLMKNAAFEVALVRTLLTRGDHGLGLLYEDYPCGPFHDLCRVSPMGQECIEIWKQLVDKADIAFLTKEELELFVGLVIINNGYRKELTSLQPELTRLEKGLVETLQAELEDNVLYIELVHILGAIKSFKLRHGDMLQAFYNSRSLTPNETLMTALRER